MFYVDHDDTVESAPEGAEGQAAQILSGIPYSREAR